MTEAINNAGISTRPLLKPDQSVVEADFEVKSAEDIDVIDTVPDEESSTEYEYYYVYYDEEGNMVNKSPPKEIPEATLNKIQDIPLASSTNKIPTTIDNHIQVCTSRN